MSTWRHEQSPQWASEIAPTVRPRTALTADEQAQVDGVVGQLRVKLAKNLNRTVDTFRQWDVDASGSISKREFREALTAMGITARKAAFEKTFDTLDGDLSGSIDYRELNAQMRRKTDGPSFGDLWDQSSLPPAAMGTAQQGAGAPPQAHTIGAQQAQPNMYRDGTAALARGGCSSQASMLSSPSAILARPRGTFIFPTPTNPLGHVASLGDLHGTVPRARYLASRGRY